MNFQTVFSVVPSGWVVEGVGRLKKVWCITRYALIRLKAIVYAYKSSETCSPHSLLQNTRSKESYVWVRVTG